MTARTLLAPRLLNWDGELVRWALDRVGTPFAWGTCDCWTLVRESQAIIWGFDRFAGIPTYDTALGAARAVRSHGGMGTVLRKAGAVSLTLPLARTGDVLVDADEHGGLGAALTVLAATQAVGVGPDGVVEIVPLQAAPASYTCFGWRR